MHTYSTYIQYNTVHTYMKIIIIEIFNSPYIHTFMHTRTNLQSHIYKYIHTFAIDADSF